MIPQYFHRIWIGSDPRPNTASAYGRALMDHHPGWQLCDWREGDFGTLINCDIYDAVEKPSGKANVARIEILARLGGVYIDYDMRCQKSIELLPGGRSSMVSPPS